MGLFDGLTNDSSDDLAISRSLFDRARILAKLARIPEAQAVGLVVLMVDTNTTCPGYLFGPNDTSALAGWTGNAEVFHQMVLKARILPPPPAPPPESPKLPATTSWVYFIQAGETGPIKIGWSKDPQQRLSALQTGHPEKLRLLATEPGDQRRESELHQRFAEWRCNGEWFEAGNALLFYIRSIARGGL